MKEAQPFVPAKRQETVRQSIISLLQKDEMSALDISAAVGIPVKDVYAHLEHIRHSLQRDRMRLAVRPAECRNCGFAFAKRDRLKRPGRCPVCRGESISQPGYRVIKDK